jgi:uncharacterized protein YqjF (DUF2071 family)
MSSVFLTAEWRKLIMANYPVDPSVLRDFLPSRTELDTWKGSTYVSLVGFMFREVRVRGLRIPFHTHFPEVNLRFYVRYKEGSEWKRGVVFISEIVPRPAITWVANTLFKEHYISLPMRHSENLAGSLLQVGYEWKYQGRWNQLSADAGVPGRSLAAGSKEEFITEHFWGYAKSSRDRTGEYQVAHPRWDIYGVEHYRIDCDFGGLYGAGFSELAGRVPESVFLAEGSAVSVYIKRNV